MPAFSAASQALATRATSFFTLPRELRDLIYSYHFDAVYTQSRVDVYYRDLLLDHFDSRAEAKLPNQLAIIQASRRLWEESSRILYGENLFRLHAGSTVFMTANVSQKATDLMQDVEINLYPSSTVHSVIILRLFGTPQILRRSCVIKLQFREVELMRNIVIEALRDLTGFKILTFVVDAPDINFHRQSPKFNPWVSVLLACLRDKLTPALGPSTFVNDGGRRRLIFNPQEYSGKETGAT